MDNSIYITLSRQTAMMRDMESTSNNIANVNTTGYQSSHVMFTSYMKQDGKNGGKMAFTQDISTFRNTSTGGMRATGNPLDLAIQGDGYFVVDTPLGVRYTRAGSLQLDSNGTLVTQEGYPLRDISDQPIIFNEQDRVIQVGSAGNVTVDGEERAILAVVSFENPQAMKKVGETFYTSDENPDQSVDPRVAQGVLEGSNVQPVMEMTHMMQVTRSVANTAKFIEVVYDLERKAASTWAQQS